MIELFTSVALMYTTPAYTDSNMSQNPCNSMDATSYISKNTPEVFDVPIEHEVLYSIVATVQGWVREHGHPNHISPSTCVGGQSLAWQLLEKH